MFSCSLSRRALQPNNVRSSSRPEPLSACHSPPPCGSGTCCTSPAQIGNRPGTRELADTGIAGQARQAPENVKALLAAAGSSLDRVVKCTVFLTDIKDYAAMNTVYATYFPKDPPARSTVAGSGLALGARVEIECIATAA